MKICIWLGTSCLFLWLTTPVQAGELFWSAPLHEPTAWQETQTRRFDDPAQPCTPASGSAAWGFRETGAYLILAGSLPCEAVVAPKHAPTLPESYSVEWELFIESPLQDRNLVLGWKDPDTWFGFHIFDQKIEYEKVFERKAYSAPKSSRLYPFLPKTLYSFRAEVHTKTQKVRLFINGEEVLNFQESSRNPRLSSLIPVLRASTGAIRSSSVIFTRFTIKTISELSLLSVPYLRQNDPQWAQKTYDHATDWSVVPTIERWGCALTSGVMVLRYHGITNLPDGSPLWPDALNDWLLSQPDGYFAQGHINWRALTRLSIETNRLFGTTKLEYRYENPAHALTWLAEQLHQKKPIILEQPGHFVVATGQESDSESFRIHDPFFQRSTLSEYNNAFLSARVFTPSNTDLRALSLLLPADVAVKITRNNEPYEYQPVLLHPIQDAVDGSRPGTTLQLIDLPQPHSGEYRFSFQRYSGSSFPFDAYLYDINGNVRTHRTWAPSYGTSEASFQVSEETIQPERLPTASADISALFSSSPVSLLLRNAWEKLLDCRQRGFDSGLACDQGFQLFLRQAGKNGWLNAWQVRVLESQLEKDP